MTLGEKATLTITSDYAYGDRGFPGVIPGGATLVLYVFPVYPILDM
jgi:FK506-binding protein 1